MRSKSRTFGKSAYCTKSGTFRCALVSDEKNTHIHCDSRALFTRKVPNKNKKKLHRVSVSKLFQFEPYHSRRKKPRYPVSQNFIPKCSFGLRNSSEGEVRTEMCTQTSTPTCLTLSFLRPVSHLAIIIVLDIQLVR